MPKLVPFLLLAACAGGLSANPLAAQQPARPVNGQQPLWVPQIDANGIRAHTRFLSSDLLQGRAVGTRGEQLAAEYIASQFERMGLEAPNGSYMQPVPIVSITADRQATRLNFTGPRGTLTTKFLDDVVIGTATQKENATATGEVVFVGYGVNAPELNWNDYAGLNMRGKIALVLVNDPPATTQEPNLFGGKAMTYYGRWTYKYEEAERQGAAGVLLVHTTESASYDWGVVQGSWSGEQHQLPLRPERTNPLAVQGWITQDATRRMLALGGHDLDALTRAAQRRGFKAMPTGIQLNGTVRSTLRRSQSANVVGILRGTGDEAVVYSSHYDHFGIGPAVNGDSIYNGALDNASGVAAMLEIAEGWVATRERPKRSVVFVAVTAEESGLLGSDYYAQNPVIPAAKTAANINVDLLYFLGTTRDIGQIGGDRSSLGPVLEKVARQFGRQVTGDPFPERGTFFRSDHFPFAKAGIPALYVKSGSNVEGKPAGWGEQQMADYNAKDYHKPSDDFRESWDYRGAVELSNIAYWVGYEVANAERQPEWLPTSEFQRKR